MSRIVILAGSGVSVDEPANLPSWWEYNEALVEEIKLQALLLCPEAKERLESLDVEEGLPVQCVSDIIVQGGAGESYFPLLKLLDGSTPNANHLAMVELAKAGQLYAIVTTNFDTLVETSFQSEAVPISVLFTDEDFASIPVGNACRLLKIHGSVVDEESLIDTVTQKSQGLSEKKKLALSGAMSGADVVVMGFSGADLDFDPDYIPFTSALNTGGSVTWLCRPGSAVHPAVRTLADVWGEKFRIVEQELRDFFIECGVSYDDLVEKASNLAHAARGNSAKRIGWGDARREIRNLFSQLHLGPHACVGYCIEMLSLVGKSAEAKSLAEIYEGKLDLQRLDILSVNGIYSLAHQKAAGGDFASARKWMSVAIICLTTMDSMAKDFALRSDAAANDRETSRMQEHRSNMATAYLNRGIYSEKDGDLETFMSDLERAQAYAEVCGNERALGMVTYGKVRARFASDNDYDSYIVGLKECKGIIDSSGNMRGLAEVLLDECEAHLTLGEYAIAGDILDNCSVVLKNVGSFDLLLRQLSLKVELSIRRGEESEALVAMEFLVSAIERAESKEWAGNTLLLLAQGLRCDENTTNFLIRLTRIVGYDSSQAVEEYRSFDDGWWGAGNPIPAWIGERIPEDDLRNMLVVCEYGHHEVCQNVLHMLCVQYVERKSWTRLLDLASCYFRSAISAEAKAKARYFAGCAYVEQGQYALAEKEFRAVLSTCVEMNSEYVAWTHAGFARIRMAQGNFDAADGHYRAILDSDLGVTLTDATVNICMACIQQLVYLKKWEDAKAKTEELLGKCTVEQAEGIRAVLEMIERKTREEHGEIELGKMGPEDIATYANNLYRECGDAERAYDLLLTSKRKYEHRGDFVGVAKCENNLGVILVEEGRYEDAKEHFMKSLHIHDKAGCERDAMRQLAWAINLRVDGVDVSEEVADAERRIKLHQPSPERSLLLLSLYYYYFMEKRSIEAYAYAKQVLEHEDHFVRYGAGYTSEIDASTFETMRDFVSLVESCYTSSKERFMSDDKFITSLGEATRLYHAHEFEASHALLDKLGKDVEYDAERLGQVCGTRGNALLKEGKYLDAVRQFRESISHFNESAQQDKDVDTLRLTAYNGLLLALDGSGRAEETLEETGNLLSVYGVSHDTFCIAINHCNRLLEKHRVWKKGDQVYTRIKDLFDELKDIEDLTLGESGVLSFAYGNLCYHVQDMEEALGHFKDARHYFANANSPELALAEKMIEMIEAGME